MKNDLTEREKLALFVDIRNIITKQIKGIQGGYRYQGLGFCTLLFKVLMESGRLGKITSDESMLDAFPEFHKYKPNQMCMSSGYVILGGAYWFNTHEEGMKKRLEIINEIIAEQIKRT